MNDYYDPYRGFGTDGRTWKKSQFHMHNMSWDEDGNFRETLDGMKAFFQEYKDSDYDIVAHAGHNLLLDTSGLDEELGIRSYNGEEYVDLDGILLVGISKVLRGEPQDVIDACVADGGFAVICHPNQNPALNHSSPIFPPLLTRDVSTRLTGAVGVEIYSACLSRRQMNGVGFGVSLATDYWDDALTSGRRLWGFATDDSHQGYEINIGWTEVLAATTDFPEVRSSVESGAIVASRGLRLYNWIFDGTTLRVEADLPYFRTGKAEYRFIGDGGEVLQETTGEGATYRLNGTEKYVRVEARNDDGSILWTQPLLSQANFDLP